MRGTSRLPSRAATGGIDDGGMSRESQARSWSYLVECRNRDEAIAIAQRIPTLRAGDTVEVRALEAADAAPEILTKERS